MLNIRRSHHFGAFLRSAIESWDEPKRVAVIGTGGLSRWVGMPDMGRVNSEFDRWFLDALAAGDFAGKAAFYEEAIAIGLGAIAWTPVTATAVSR